MLQKFITRSAFCFFLIALTSISSMHANDATKPVPIESTKTIANVAKKAIPAVVFIKGQTSCNDNETDYYPFNQFNDEFFRRFFGNAPHQRGLPAAVGGSGFLVSNDGYIVTNDHVVRDVTNITVTTNKGEEFKAEVIGRDSATEIAILKIDGKNLPFLSFGNSDELEVGEWVVAIGNPYELQSTLTAGVVSAKGRQNLNIAKLEDFIQTDASINPGNSGGPLLNMNGDVIGINTAIVSSGGHGGCVGIGFAVPSKIAKHVMDQIINNGTVSKGYLGIFLQPIDKEMAEALNIEKSEGALISDVAKDSPAEKGGLKQGDVIIKCNGAQVKSITQLRNDISLMDPGQKVKLTILRDGKEEEITITLGTAPEKLISNRSESVGLEVTDPKEVEPELLQKWGYSMNTEGVIITNVKMGSPADRAGIKAGMLLLQVNRSKMKSAEDFQKALQASANKKIVLLLIRYQNATRFVSIKLK